MSAPLIDNSNTLKSINLRRYALLAALQECLRVNPDSNEFCEILELAAICGDFTVPTSGEPSSIQGKLTSLLLQTGSEKALSILLRFLDYRQLQVYRLTDRQVRSGFMVNYEVPDLIQYCIALPLPTLVSFIQYWKSSIPEEDHVPLIRYLVWLSQAKANDQVFEAVLQAFQGHEELTEIRYQEQNWYAGVVFWHCSEQTAMLEYVLAHTADDQVHRVGANWLFPMLRARNCRYSSLILDRFPELCTDYVNLTPGGHAYGMSGTPGYAEFAAKYGPGGSVRLNGDAIRARHEAGNSAD